MRSTQKEIARLYREVWQAIGVKTNHEACEHVSKAANYYTTRLNRHGITAVMVTPYKNNTWGIYGLCKACEIFMPLSTESMLDSPVTNKNKFLAIAGL